MMKIGPALSTSPSETRRISAPPGVRLYAIGDVHGRLDLLESLLDGVLEDSKSSAADRKVVVFLGDLIDRGPDSRAVIERVMAGPQDHWRGFQWITLRGNHEDIMLRFLSDANYGANWIANGGLSTIASYVGDLDISADDVFALQAALNRSLPRAHRRFLEALPYSHQEGGYVFVHAGIRPGIPMAAQTAEDLMWIRREFLDSGLDHGAVIVHGHTIVKEPDERPNRIGIDTGAYSNGRLTGLVVEGDRHWFLSSAAPLR
jgi:serine/threonine protein phosphatase 1